MSGKSIRVPYTPGDPCHCGQCEHAPSHGPCDWCPCGNRASATELSGAKRSRGPGGAGMRRRARGGR